jgi:GDP-4-dehydro-6-deoxy-D-mannose reductase
MKVLLLGGDSPLGIFLVEYWSRIFPKVEFLKTSRRPLASKSSLYLDFPNSSLDKIIRQVKPDVVLNLISYRGPDKDLASTINVELPRQILRIQSEELDFHAVFFGSAAEYGLRTKHEILSENSTLKPQSVYGVSKARQSELAESAVQASASISYLRIFNLYGLGMSTSLLPGRLEKSINDLKHSVNREIHLGNTNDVRDFISTVKFADVLGELVLRRYSGVINIASGVGMEVGDFARMFVETVLDVKEIEWRMSITSHPTFSVADLSKLKEEFLDDPLYR